MRFTYDVKEYALQHYEKDGWDIVVECYSDAEISEITRHCRTKEDAIQKVKEHVAPYYGRQQEVRAEAF